MANNMVQMARSNHVGLLVRSDGGSPTISINNVQKPTGAVMLTKASPFTEAEVQRHSARLGMPLTQKTVKVGSVNKYTLVTKTAFDDMPTIFKVPKELQGTEGIIMMDAKGCSIRIRGVNGEPAVVMEPLKQSTLAKRYRAAGKMYVQAASLIQSIFKHLPTYEDIAPYVPKASENIYPVWTTSDSKGINYAGLLARGEHHEDKLPAVNLTFRDYVNLYGKGDKRVMPPVMTSHEHFSEPTTFKVSKDIVDKTNGVIDFGRGDLQLSETNPGTFVVTSKEPVKE